MQETLKYPQVTQIQVDLWLKDPTTKAFISCLEFQQDDIKDVLGSGSIVDPSSSDLTLSRISQCRGQVEGLESAAKPEVLLNHYKMIGGDNV